MDVSFYLLYETKRENYRFNSSTYMFVTSYFFTKKNKHTESEFMEWMNNFFSLINKSVIIFTDKNSIKYIPPNNGKYYIYNSIFDVPCVSKYKHIYSDQNSIDPERFRNHSSELYGIWNSKVCMLRIATELYNRSIYIWIVIESDRFKYFRIIFPNDKVISYLSSLNSMFFFCCF